MPTTTAAFVTPPANLAERAAAVELPVYSQMGVVPVRGEGCCVYDEAGRRYLDLYGGHAVALTGHCHPHVVDAIREQASKLIFYSSAVHSPLRVVAAELLLRHAPHADSRVFFVNSGAEANEAALKLARKSTGRRKVVSFEGDFHGRTLAALSATGLPKYRATAGPVLAPDHVYAPFGDVAALEKFIDADTAAVICEPIQSLGGVRQAEPRFYQRMAELTRAVGAALIFDELQTGLGRCGRFLFGELVGVRPDMVSLAKGLASGVPCGALLVAPQWWARVQKGDQGCTFGGGHLAMAAMKATLEVIEREGLVANAAKIGARLLAELPGVSGVLEARGAGLLIGIELRRNAKEVQTDLLRHGVIVGESSTPTSLRLLPPLTLSDAHVDEFLGALRAVL